MNGPRRWSRRDVDALFTQIWFLAVKTLSGLSSAYAIERSLEPKLVRPGADGINRPRKWDAYRDGRRVPTRKLGSQCALDIAEIRYPGTSKYFDTPLRALLQKDSMDAEWIDEQLRTLEPKVTNLLFGDRSTSATSNPSLRAFDHAQARRLVELGGFDSLVAAVLLMARFDLIGAPRARRFAWMAYHGIQFRARPTQESFIVAEELFRLIDTRFHYVLYPRPDVRQEIWLGGPFNVDACLESEAKLMQLDALLDRIYNFDIVGDEPYTPKSFVRTFPNPPA